MTKMHEPSNRSEYAEAAAGEELKFLCLFISFGFKYVIKSTTISFSLLKNYLDIQFQSKFIIIIKIDLLISWS